MTLLPQGRFLLMMNNTCHTIIPSLSENVYVLRGLPLIVDCVAVGSALVAHLAYYWQAKVLEQTDVLDRYKSLVIEKVGGDLLLYDN